MPMIPILRRTRHLTVAGMAAGTLVTAGLVGQLATQQSHHASGTTVPAQTATGGGSATASPSASSAQSSQSDNSYRPVPSVTDGGNGGADTTTRGS